MSARVVILIPPSQRADPQAHHRKAHTCHTPQKKEAHSEKEKGEREREKACEPLLSLCIRAEARLWLQSVLKSLPGVHSQPWTQEERDGEGETSKVNTTGSYGPAQYICHLEEERKKMKQNAKTWTLFLIDLHQSASDSNVCLRTQMCIHTQKSSTVDFYSFITKRKKSHLLHAWVCKTQGESAQRTERELGSRLHGNKEDAGASTCRNNSENTTRTRAAGLLCISLFLCHSPRVFHHQVKIRHNNNGVQQLLE